MNAIVIETYGDMTLVQTPFGNVVGKWCSDKPVALKKYILELDCDDIVTPENIQTTVTSKPFIANRTDRVTICGLVEEIEDRLMYVRIEGDLLMLDILPISAYEKFINHYVQINLSSIHFYDTGLC